MKIRIITKDLRGDAVAGSRHTAQIGMLVGAVASPRLPIGSANGGWRVIAAERADISFAARFSEGADNSAKAGQPRSGGSFVGSDLGRILR